MTTEDIKKIDDTLQSLYYVRKIMPEIKDSLTRAISDIENRLVEFILHEG